MLTKENITLKRNWIWDVLEIDLTEVCVLQNDKEINLPITIVIPIYYKMKMRQLLRNGRRDHLHPYVMLKKRKTWFNLENMEHE